MPKILVIDDEQPLCWAMRKLFEKDGHEVGVAGTAAAGLEAAKAMAPDVILLDVRLPDDDGLRVLALMKESGVTGEVVVMTAHGTMETAVEAMRKGAFDYLVKPVDSERARLVVGRAARVRAISAELKELKARVSDMPRSTIVGASAPMQEVFKLIGVASLSDAPVMLLGETGTGKDLVARAIHDSSERANGSFVPVHCAAIPEALLESELFGFQRGAFTGAFRSSQGRIARAHGGTLFLDEVGEIPPAIQVKLLRCLDEGAVEGIGSGGPTRVDFRLICATNADLDSGIANGVFREDLYFRLNVFPIRIPPLRERSGDVKLLARHFLSASAGPSADISEEALDLLSAHDWPGNVRELKNAVEHATVLARGRPLLPEHLPINRERADRAQAGAGEVSRRVEQAMARGMENLYDEFLPDFERPLIGTVLRLTGGNQVKAARVLGMHRTTLRKKIDLYNL